MPDLNFRITGVDPVDRGLTPLLHFQLEITNSPATESIHTVMVQAQIQIQSPQRTYSASEKEKLGDLSVLQTAGARPCAINFGPTRTLLFERSQGAR